MFGSSFFSIQNVVNRFCQIISINYLTGILWREAEGILVWEIVFIIFHVSWRKVTFLEYRQFKFSENHNNLEIPRKYQEN